MEPYPALLLSWGSPFPFCRELCCARDWEWLRVALQHPSAGLIDLCGVGLKAVPWLSQGIQRREVAEAKLRRWLLLFVVAMTLLLLFLLTWLLFLG